MAVKKVAFLTAGGLAPCLSSSIGFLIDEYTKKAPEIELIGYINGYMGLLKGESIKVTPEVRKHALVLTKHGGSPIGNSRVKLTNAKDCYKRKLVNVPGLKEEVEEMDRLDAEVLRLSLEENELIEQSKKTKEDGTLDQSVLDVQAKLAEVKAALKKVKDSAAQKVMKVAADQLVKDGVDVLHTIGGDDTNTTAADLAAYLAKNNYALTVVGLPKTIDNDVYPIKQSLGAYTAAEEGAKFFANVVKENSANPRALIIHEVMGRNCGWLTAFTAIAYHKMLDRRIQFVPDFGLTRERQDVHAVYVPEAKVDIEKEAERLRKVMDKVDCVNIFVSEGACVKQIIAELKKQGVEVPLDAFGHPRLDKVNVGQYFANQFAKKLGAEKTQVFKSGYFARAAAPNKKDLRLIQQCAVKAVECALKGEGGVIGKDEDNRNELRACEFPRIRGGKPFNVRNSRFRKLLAEIGQDRPRKTRDVKKTK